MRSSYWYFIVIGNVNMLLILICLDRALSKFLDSNSLWACEILSSIMLAFFDLINDRFSIIYAEYLYIWIS